MPSFQRPFTWRKDIINRFFEGLVDGTSEFVENSGESAGTATETFLGTIVCFEDKPPYQVVYPSISGEVPEAVFVLIDGQQRMSTLIATALLLHDFLRRKKVSRQGKIETGEQSSGTDKLFKQQQKTMAELYAMLKSVGTWGDRKYYPRIIRGFDDQWSLDRKKSRYKSPLSSLISQYIDFVEDWKGTETRSDKFSFKPSSGKDKKHHTVFYSAYKHIKVCIKDIAEYGDSSDNFDGNLPDIKKVFCAEGRNILQELFQETDSVDYFAEAERACQQEGASENAQKELNNQYALARAILLSAYFMKRVKMVKTVTKSDEYAYRIFDSLNTTGTPLTAYETFVPEVIRQCGSSEQYEASVEKKRLDEMKEYLTDDKDGKKAKALITSFALAERGKKLPSDLSAQRHFLRNNYRKDVGFIDNLVDVARTFEPFHNKKEYYNTPLFRFLVDRNFIEGDEHTQYVGEACFGLRCLMKANHTITVPLISRFYARATGSKEKSDHKELCQVIRATAAFLCLWNMSRKGSDSIDTHHRGIMNDLGFTREANKKLSIAFLQERYWKLLSEETKNKRQVKDSKTWIDYSLTIPIYENRNYAVTFAVLLDTYGGGSAPADQLRFSDQLWDHSAYQTIEHIQPQSSRQSEGEPIDRELLDSIGNLTLLPMEINAYIGNVPWNIRRVLYLALSSDTQEEWDKRFKVISVHVKKDKIGELKAKTQVLREKESKLYLPSLKSIAEFEKFESEEIKNRGETVLSKVWPILMQWLGRDA